VRSAAYVFLADRDTRHRDCLIPNVAYQGQSVELSLDLVSRNRHIIGW
jgi:hypothetical protein